MPQKTRKSRSSKTTANRKAAKAGHNKKQESKKARGVKAVRSRATKRAFSKTAPVSFVAGGDNNNLEKIDHIVVLMMENRSFDHMLGYLKLEGTNPEVDGLDSEMSNTYAGKTYAVHRLPGTVFEHDPGHQGDAVAEQLSNHGSGFVANYVSIHAEDDPALIMGYHNGS